MTDANETAWAMTPPSRGQRVLMPLLSLALFLAASSAIYHLLQELNVDSMLAELRQLSSGQLGLALLLTAASYTVLIGYDWIPSSQSILSRRSRHGEPCAGRARRLREHLAPELSWLDFDRIPRGGAVALPRRLSLAPALVRP
ncbi:MAG: hypothetical protein M3436_13955 [Pseudomonadota bacterium]|nr:hypothetical protein [Pseudomonadota bacterium]